MDDPPIALTTSTALTAPPSVLAELPDVTRSQSRCSTATLGRNEHLNEQQQLDLASKVTTRHSARREGKEGDEEMPANEDALSAFEAQAAELQFPDGGLRAYLAAVGGSLVLLATFGFSNAWGAIQAELQRNQLHDQPTSSVALIGSLHLGILFACSLPAGRYFDLGYFQLQLAVGSVLWVFGIFMLSLSTKYYQFLLSYSVCMGLALGIVYAPTLSCVGSYFLKKRSLMLGFVAGGSALGAVFLPVAMNRMFASSGFPTAIRILGALIAGILVVCNLIMRPRKLPPKSSVKTFPLLKGFLRQRSMWYACLGGAFVMFGLFTPLFYIQIFAEEKGESRFVIEYSIALINATAFVARPIMGLVADRFGSFNVATPVAFCTAVLCFAMLGATSTGGAIAFCLLYGWFQGAWVTHMSPSWMSLALDVSEIGARTGLGFLFVSVATLIGNPIAGALLHSTGSYVAPICFAGSAILVGTVLFGATRQTQVARKGHWKV